MEKTAEGELLKEDASNYDSSAYKKPSVTVDIIICSIIDKELKVLLIKRKNPLYSNHWAIPGGFVDIDKNENLEKTVERELLEETNISGIYFEQLKTYGEPDRDPRMRIISVAYFVLVPIEKITSEIKAGSDAKETQWFPLRNLPEQLAFDHQQILKDTLERILNKISYTPIAFSFLQTNFTWSDLKLVYETILMKKMNDGNFRRKINSQYKISKSVGVKTGVGRPAHYLNFNGIKEKF